jgi:hypothetical protein
MKRHRRIPVAVPALLGLMRHGSGHSVVDGIPDQTVFVEWRTDPIGDKVWLIVEHPSFDEVPDDAEPPIMDIVFWLAPWVKP